MKKKIRVTIDFYLDKDNILFPIDYNVECNDKQYHKYNLLTLEQTKGLVEQLRCLILKSK